MTADRISASLRIETRSGRAAVTRVAAAALLAFAIAGSAVGAEPSVDLVAEIEQGNPEFVKRSAEGCVTGLVLTGAWCSSNNLGIVSRVPGLRELTFDHAAKSLDAGGVRCLTNCPGLMALCFRCWGQLPPGVLAAASEISGIRRLKLIAADAGPAEYAALARMSNLTELVVGYSHNFTDADLHALRLLPALCDLRVTSEQLGPRAPPMLQEFPSLTNAQLSGKSGFLARWEPHPGRKQSGGTR